MNHLRSILERLNQFRGNAWVQSFEKYWHQATASQEYSWLLLVMMVFVVLSSLFWTKARLAESSELSLRQFQMQNTPLTRREPFQLGAQRLMGTPSPRAMMAERVQIQAIIFNSEPAQREVLLTDSTGSVKSYKIGDHLPGGSEIIAIEQQSITIERDGIKNQFQMNQYPSTFISDQPLQQNNSILQ
jgi:hypothetical protein